uniref:Uncharacterized protein n=1 Tax=Amphora coffeiformis TaxID=265554 RepID=A0A7S3P5H9_9STRA
MRHSTALKEFSKATKAVLCEALGFNFLDSFPLWILRLLPDMSRLFAELLVFLVVNASVQKGFRINLDGVPMFFRFCCCAIPYVDFSVLFLLVILGAFRYSVLVFLFVHTIPSW